MLNQLEDNINRQRDRDSRVNGIDSQSAFGDYGDRQGDGTGGIRDSSGYWNGANYTNFFTIGVSALGGSDVLE